MPELKPVIKPAKAVPVQVQPDELKAAIKAICDHAQAAMAAADLQGQIDVLCNDLAKAEQRAAVAEAKAQERTAAADERAETIADLRARLDREGEERRRLMAILTHQKDSSATQSRSFWRRFFS